MANDSKKLTTSKSTFNISETKSTEKTESIKPVITSFLKIALKKGAFIMGSMLFGLIGLGLTIYGFAENALFVVIGIPLVILSIAMYNNAKKLD